MEPNLGKLRKRVGNLLDVDRIEPEIFIRASGSCINKEISMGYRTESDTMGEIRPEEMTGPKN